jgi:hypothetical protein
MVAGTDKTGEEASTAIHRAQLVTAPASPLMQPILP